MRLCILPGNLDLLSYAPLNLKISRNILRSNMEENVSLCMSNLLNPSLPIFTDHQIYQWNISVMCYIVSWKTWHLAFHKIVMGDFNVDLLSRKDIINNRANILDNLDIDDVREIFIAREIFSSSMFDEIEKKYSESEDQMSTVLIEIWNW